MLLAADTARPLGGEHPRLTVGESPKAPGSWMGKRVLFVDGKPGFELSFWCGTCPFLFQREPLVSTTYSLEQMNDGLAAGLDDLDEEVITTYDALLRQGRYLPMLLSVAPRLVAPGGREDYFSHEQVQTWGVDGASGLPEYPATFYYRTFETPVRDEGHLYEFVVPLQPPIRNDREQVEFYRARLAESSTPTALAMSILDVCTPVEAEPGRDWYEHWCLTHFLLDGHHKMQAAADTGASLRLLSLLAVDVCLAGPEEIARVTELRKQPRQLRDSSTTVG